MRNQIKINSTEEFIAEAKRIYPNENYDYSQVVYTKKCDYVTIICPTHGPFKKQAYSFLAGKKCPKCVRQEHTKTNEQFIKELKERFGDKFDYSEVNYINNATPVILICNTCGNRFKSRPNNLLHATNPCKKCLIESQRKGIDWFIKESRGKFGNKFDYSQAIYINNKTKIKLKCPEHGWFEINPMTHLKSKTGCIYCDGKKNTEIFTPYGEEFPKAW